MHRRFPKRHQVPFPEKIGRRIQSLVHDLEVVAIAPHGSYTDIILKWIAVFFILSTTESLVHDTDQAFAEEKLELEQGSKLEAAS